MKINIKWWKIKRKSRNLTQISLRNDPINRRMQGFSFRIFEDEYWRSRWCDFFLLAWLNLKFKHLMEVEMSCEHSRKNGTRNDGDYKENLVKNHGPFLSARRTSFKKVKRVRGRSMKIPSRWTAWITRRSIETTLHLIGVGSWSCG